MQRCGFDRGYICWGNNIRHGRLGGTHGADIAVSTIFIGVAWGQINLPWDDDVNLMIDIEGKQ